MVAVAHGCHSSLEHENIQSLCTKLLSLFESQFVGGDEDKPAQLFSFLDQIRTDVITSNNVNTEGISKNISSSSHIINSLTSLIKQKDGDIAALSKNLNESEEK